MNKTCKVLVFPCNSENALEIFRSLRHCVNVELFGISNLECHAQTLFKNFQINFPNYDDKNFIDTFNEFIHNNQINFIFPTHDDIVLFLSKKRKVIQANIIASDYETALLCRKKNSFYKKIKDKPYCPMVFSKNDKLLDKHIFIKPNEGQGGIGGKKIETKSFSFSDLPKDIIVMEYLPNKEFTIDCFTTKNGNLLFHGIRERKRTMDGICTRGKVIFNDQISEIAFDINNSIRFRGAWFFQVKYDKNGNPKVLEISSRISGTMNTFRQNGINFPLLALNDKAGNELSIINNNLKYEVDRCLQSRYINNLDYEYIYVDLDDTLILNKKYVNYELLSFLYKSLNKEKKIILITRNKMNINNILEKYCLHKNIFTKILQIDLKTKKSKFIENHDNAIFIDNSFHEREEVKNNTKANVFDIDSLEFLLS